MKIASIVKEEETKIPFYEIKDWYEENMSPDKIDLEDQEVYEDIYHNGKWAGVFQASNKNTQKFFQKAKPRNIVDIAIVTSIWRPGPLAANVHELFIKAKTKNELYDWGDKRINDILAESYGNLIFQESVMEIANKIAGFPLDECDKVRKTIMKRTAGESEEAKKKTLEFRKKFIDGCIKNNVDEKTANELYDRIGYFASYGFNKSLEENELVSIYNDQGNKLCDKKIKDVISGDIVRSRDEKTKEDIYIPVKENHYHGKLKVFKIKLDSGEEVKCTINHKFRTTGGEMLPLWKILEQNLDIVVSAEEKQQLQKTYQNMEKDVLPIKNKNRILKKKEKKNIFVNV